MKCTEFNPVRFLEKTMSVDEELEFLYHLDHCEVCFEALYWLFRERDSRYFLAQRKKASHAWCTRILKESDEEIG